MNYLFFKTAVNSLNEGKPTFLQFGYTLVDDRFSLLEEKNIDIAPDCLESENLELLKFSVSHNENNLSYYASCPKLEEVYDKIHALLSDSSTQVVAYEGALDCLALLSACQEKNLPLPECSILELTSLALLLQGPVSSLRRRCSLLGYKQKEFIDATSYTHAEMELLRRLYSQYQLSYDDLNDYTFDICFSSIQEQADSGKSRILYNAKRNKARKSLNIESKKHYLFFDLECANNHDGIGKICEFGAVIVNKDFQIEKRIDMLINPEDVFDLSGRRGKEGIELYYSETQYKSHRAFPDQIEEIRRYLEDEETLVLGHAVDNDIHFLEADAESYELPGFHFSALDTQPLFAYLYGFERKISLEAGMDVLYGLGYRKKFYEHHAVEDSEMTYLLMKAMLEKFGLTLEEAVSKCPEMVVTSSGLLDCKNAPSRNIRRLQKYSTYKDRFHNRDLVDQAIYDDAEYLGPNETLYYVSNEARNGDTELETIVDRIHDEYGLFIEYACNADYIVALDEEDFENIQKRFPLKPGVRPIYVD